MATITIMAISTPGLSGTLSWSILGFMLLAVGILTTFLSGRRYLLGYLLAGMSYWIVIEGIQSIMVNTTSMSSGFGYLTAVLLSVIMVGIYLTYRYQQFVANMKAQDAAVATVGHRATPVATRVRSAKVRTPHDKYIEHTPIYNNYKPRFRN